MFVLLCLAWMPAHADEHFGDWSVGRAFDGGYYAATTLDLGGVIGKYCYKSKHVCYWLMQAKSSCDKGDAAPAIVNASAGSSAISFVCTGRHSMVGGTEYYQQAIVKPDAMDEAVSKSQGVIGIAYPMLSGAFEATRFSLNGAAEALAELYSQVGFTPGSGEASGGDGARSGSF